MTTMPTMHNNMPKIDTIALAKVGFMQIRNLLEGRLPGGSAAAFDLAEALHNLPEPGNAFLHNLTLRNLEQVIVKYPQLRSSLVPFMQ